MNVCENNMYISNIVTKYMTLLRLYPPVVSFSTSIIFCVNFIQN